MNTNPYEPPKERCTSTGYSKWLYEVAYTIVIIAISFGGSFTGVYAFIGIAADVMHYSIFDLGGRFWAGVGTLLVIGFGTLSLFYIGCGLIPLLIREWKTDYREHHDE